jgi:hypothetical protein
MKLITKAIINALAKTPYGKTDGQPREDKKVIARYFGGAACTWYVLEDDSFFTDAEHKDDQHIDENMVVFAACSLGYGFELGSVSIKELSEMKFPIKVRCLNGQVVTIGYSHVERDRFVEPLKKTLGQLMKAYKEEWM